MAKPFTAREGFEPPVGFEPTAIFETAPFGHSGTSPTKEYYNISKPRVRNPKSWKSIKEGKGSIGAIYHPNQLQIIFMCFILLT